MCASPSVHGAAVRLDIAAGPATDSLKQFIQQTQVQLVYDAELIRGASTQAVSGNYEPIDALKVMFADAALQIESVGEQVLVITRARNRQPGRDRPGPPPASRPIAQPLASASPDAGLPLPEVIVTAERRATAEQITAISMNVLTGEDLANTATKYIDDLQQTTPNVTISNSSGFNLINIRGVGNSTITPAVTTGVAVLQDGILIGETVALGSQFLDLGTVEVLRGPQGTFIGTASTGGAIRLNSVRPELDGDTSGYLEAGIGKRSNVRVLGAVDLPITDTLAARLAFNQEKRGSYFYSKGSVTNTAPSNPYQEQGKVEDMNARISLLWRPSDNLELLWRSETNRGDSEYSPLQPNPRTFLNAMGEPTHSRYWDYDAPVDPDHDPHILSMNSLESQWNATADRHSLEVSYEFDGGLTLRSLTGMIHNDIRQSTDPDGSFASAVTGRTGPGPDDNYYTQELNLISPDARFNWVAGTWWYYRTTPVNQITEAIVCGINPVTGISTACPGQFNIPIPTQINVNEYVATVRTGGVFGQINWQFVEDLELTVGVRYNIDRNYTHGRYRPLTAVQINVYDAVRNPTPAGAICPPEIQDLTRYSQVDWTRSGCVFTSPNGEYEDETPTWKVGLNWTPGANHFVYLFWARGYKAGGVDNSANQFYPEQLDDYELGWKSTFADGRMQLALNGFYMDYQSMQQSAFRAGTAIAGTAVFNIGDATVQGIEAEFNARLGGFGIQANVGWVDSRLGDIRLIDRTTVLDSLVRAPGSNVDLRQCGAGEAQALVSGGCVNWAPYYKTLSGSRNVYSPEWQYDLSIQYEFIVGNATWTPRIGFSHTDEADTNLIRREDFWRLDARNLAHASLTYTQGSWLVQAYCQNCTDRTYIAAIGTGTGGGFTNDTVIYGNPRVWGVRVRKTF